MRCCPISDGFSLKREAGGTWKKGEKTDTCNDFIESLNLYILWSNTAISQINQKRSKY